MEDAPSAIKMRLRKKQVEFRKYLSDTGVAHCIVGMMKDLLDMPEKVPVGDVLSKYFGDFKDPRWDEHEGLRMSMNDYRAANVQLESRILNLQTRVTRQSKKLDVLKWLSALYPGKSEVPKKEFALVMMKLGDAKKINVQLLSHLPETISIQQLASFSSENEAAHCLITEWKGGETPWANAPPVSEFIEFWRNYTLTLNLENNIE
jgi:hypothetical protein